jgi:ATP-dependent DNA helicase RecQ
VLFNYADVQTQEFFIEGANPTREVIAALYHALRRLCAGGPIEMPIAEIAEHVSEATNELAVGSALYLLERGGFIQRTYRKGSRTYTTWLVEPVKPLEQLPIDLTRLDAKRERDFAKLRRMLDYVDHQGCRHRFILGYFGDQEAVAHCQACDRCLSHVQAARRLPTEEETVIIQKALSCVARLNGRFGRARITQTLVGSRSKEVLDARLDRFSTYGLLSDLGADHVWGLLNALIEAGCIAASDSRYPTLALTKLGGEVMRRNKSVPLVVPERAESRTPKSLKRKSPRSAEDRQELRHNETLFEALRTWRREKAVELGNLPAYVVYADRTLKELAARMPQTQADLLEVPGIGPAKVRQYGAETLAVIRKLSGKNR